MNYETKNKQNLEKMEYALKIWTNDKNETVFAPTSCLDNILTRVSDKQCVQIHYYNPDNGTEITSENINQVYKTFSENVENKIYTCTDHFIICGKVTCDIIVNDVKTTKIINCLFVSLDNSARANLNGYPLYARIDAICTTLNNIINNLDNCIISFSEACRDSFLGSMNDKKNVNTWEQISEQIQLNCGIVPIVTAQNNPNPMSFGISVFCTPNVLDLIETFYCKQILPGGFGCIAIGIKLIHNKIIWFTQFPLDFKGIGSDNLGYQTTKNLILLFEEFPDSLCAIGDLNSTPGAANDAIKLALPNEYCLLNTNVCTFVGTYFDTPFLGNDSVCELITNHDMSIYLQSNLV